MAQHGRFCILSFAFWRYKLDNLSLTFSTFNLTWARPKPDWAFLLSGLAVQVRRIASLVCLTGNGTDQGYGCAACRVEMNFLC